MDRDEQLKYERLRVAHRDEWLAAEKKKVVDRDEQLKCERLRVAHRDEWLAAEKKKVAKMEKMLAEIKACLA